jgi:hypothetical protein
MFIVFFLKSVYDASLPIVMFVSFLFRLLKYITLQHTLGLAPWTRDQPITIQAHIYMHAFTGICTHGLSVQAVRQGMH